MGSGTVIVSDEGCDRHGLGRATYELRFGAVAVPPIGKAKISLSLFLQLAWASSVLAQSRRFMGPGTIVVVVNGEGCGPTNEDDGEARHAVASVFKGVAIKQDVGFGESRSWTPRLQRSSMFLGLELWNGLGRGQGFYLSGPAGAYCLMVSNVLRLLASPRVLSAYLLPAPSARLLVFTLVGGEKSIAPRPVRLPVLSACWSICWCEARLSIYNYGRKAEGRWTCPCRSGWCGLEILGATKEENAATTKALRTLYPSATRV